MAARVLASPGAPSMRTWPLASSPTSSRSSMYFWPTTVRSSAFVERHGGSHGLGGSGGGGGSIYSTPARRGTTASRTGQDGRYAFGIRRRIARRRCPARRPLAPTAGRRTASRGRAGATLTGRTSDDTGRATLRGALTRRSVDDEFRAASFGAIKKRPGDSTRGWTGGATMTLHICTTGTSIANRLDDIDPLSVLKNEERFRGEVARKAELLKTTQPKD